MSQSRPDATLYAIPGSHACESGALMLEHKRIPYRRVDLRPGLHPISIRLRGFPGNSSARTLDEGKTTRGLDFANRMGTVPAVKLADERVQTNHAIARRLEELEPEPPLFPEDPERRRQVEEAEAWGDDPFQMVARRLVFAAALHGPDSLYNRGGAGRLGPLLMRNDRTRLLGARIFGGFTFEANLDTERAMLAELPAMLDRIEAWIAAGVLNSDELNAGDYMIAPSLALLSYRVDLGPGIESRPAGALVERVFTERAGPAG